MSKKKVIIVGAGPGGLAAAMLLGHRGFDVSIFEKADQPGGRTAEIKLNDYRFDIGPTFFMFKSILDGIFKETGRQAEDYLDFIKLAPAYRLVYPDNQYLDIYDDHKKMKEELKRVFPGEEDGLDLFLQKEGDRFQKLMPLLEKDNNKISDIASNASLKAISSLAFGQSVYDIMGRYFKTPEARLSFTFQAKYLGMSPWRCPGAFGMVPYVEHAFGVYHIKGGISEASRQMAKVAQEEGVKIFLNKPVRQLVMDGRRIKAIELEDGQKEEADAFVINADFGYALSELVPPGYSIKYAPKKLNKKKISCSIFIMYLGVKKNYNLQHNTIVFAKNYKKNVNDVFSARLSGEDISFYVRDHSLTDPSLAAQGKTALYVLVPVPNTRANINWSKEKANLRKWTLDSLKQRLGLLDIEEQIETEKIITPLDWENDYNVYRGAVFNLAHNLSQMIWFRPRNKFEEMDNCYLTGGGTHPGSGLPTIYQSGKIVADLISK